MPMHHSPSVSPTSSRRNGRNGIDYVVHHHKYYLIGGDLFVLIDDVMFKIHSYFFKRESRNFFDDEPPAGSDTLHSNDDARGASESRAIRIPHVTIEEFERFLWVFYNPTYDIYDADIYSWFSILKLAHRWDFPVVKDFALRELKRRESEIPLVKRIRLYQEYEAPAELLVPLFAQLCARDISPSDTETAELGFEQMCRVWKAREALRSPGGVSPLPSGVTERETYSTVSEVMGLPTYPLDDWEKTKLNESQPEEEELATEPNTAPIIMEPKKKARKGRSNGT